jgi:hypothetical protein
MGGARSVATMRWFRSRSSLGAWLALFALTTQLVVSFGHVHLDHGAPVAGHSSVLLHVQASTGAETASLPASDEVPALADDYCAACALIHLAGTVVASEPPALPLPALFGRARTDSTAEFGLTAQSHAPFAARAPPVA